MNRNRTVQLGQKWPDGSPDSIYWIGMNSMQVGIQHCDGLVILGRECRTLHELEDVASKIREGLEEALEQAREKFRRLEK